MKVWILAQPKAGMHLCANLLEQFGFNNSRYLFFKDKYVTRKADHWINTRASWQATRDLPYQHKHLEKVFKLMKDNSFACSHMLPTNKTFAQFARAYPKIYISRPIDEIRHSAKRFMEEVEPNFGEKFSKITNEQFGQYSLWLQEPNLFHLTFDDLINKNVDKLNELQEFLFDSVRYDSSTAIQTAIDKPSPTKSSIRDKNFTDIKKKLNVSNKCVFIDKGYEYSIMDTPYGSKVKAKPCCHSDWSKIPKSVSNIPDLPTWNGEDQLTNHPVIQYFRDYIKENENLPDSCDDCTATEKLGGVSARQVAAEDEDNIKPDMLYTIDVMTGNECNLACAMCNIFSSNLIQKEADKHEDTPDVWVRKYPFEVKMDTVATFEQLDQLMSTTPAAIVKFKGGEPLLERNWRYIKAGLESGQYANTHIKLTTNGTNLSDSVLDTLSLAKRTNIILSYDGVDSVSDFIRWPMKYSKMQRALITIANNTRPNISFSSSTMINLLNISNLAKIHTTLTNNGGFKNINYDTYIKPEGHALDYRNLPRSLRVKLRNSIPVELMHNDSMLRGIIDIEHEGWSSKSEIKSTLAWFEKHRKQSLDSVFNEDMLTWYRGL